VAGRLRLSERLAALPAWVHWAGLCMAAALGALVMLAADPSRWNWQPALAASEPWRAITAAWVHLGPQHLAGNLAATAVVALLGRSAGCGRRAAVAWALAWPLTQWGLLVQPALTAYGGLSGVLHAAVAVVVWQLLRGDRGWRRAIGAALAAGLLAKLWGEAAWTGGPLRQVPGWDIAIAPAAHASGALAGWLCALACGVGSAADQAAPPAP
jgi:rhomboid family GlyGly-CTERM serine protease